MRELHGVLYVGKHPVNLKNKALLFDKLHIWQMASEVQKRGREFQVELDYLESINLIDSKQTESLREQKGSVRLDDKEYATLVADVHKYENLTGDPTLDLISNKLTALLTDTLTRALSVMMEGDFDCAPICHLQIPGTLGLPIRSPEDSNPPLVMAQAANVALKALPLPDETCAWEDILNFKSERHDKQWDLRRFLKTLATKKQSEAEIRDDIEWTLNEYTKAMELHRLKSQRSWVDVVLFGAVDIIQAIHTDDWSKALKGMLSISKRKIELFEGEMKAAGKDCAYVFDAQKRFGPN